MKAEDFAHKGALAWRLQSVLPCFRPRQPLRSGSVVPRKENEVRSLAFYAFILPLMATAACEVTVKQGNESAEPANNAAAACPWSATAASWVKRPIAGRATAVPPNG